MHTIRIPKKRPGEFRTIYVPNDEEKAACRAALDSIAKAAAAADPHGVQHGFTAARSPVTNALRHRGYRYTLSFDLSDFFDTVTPQHVPEQFRNPSQFPDGAARQGLPTSPALANLAAARMDADLVPKRTRLGVLYAYTRYADDLTFSFNAPHIAAWLKQRVPEIVSRHGFAVNPRKTHLQCSAAGRRMVTGVAVSEDALHVPRAIKRKLRAARHQGKPSRIAGLEEWARLKLPNHYTEPATLKPTTPHTAAQTNSTPKPKASFGVVVRRIA